MPIAFVSGDLFANRHKAQALAHGCNCQGSMGAGIDTGFRERYRAMYVGGASPLSPPWQACGRVFADWAGTLYVYEAFAAEADQAPRASEE
jgi:O-acetyl-ADP-ribose deacetylase (regulator of RNase III)